MFILMAHGIMDHDSVLCVQKRPWHDLGIVVNEAPTIERALELSGLNWEVYKGELFDKEGRLHEVQYTYRNIVENGNITKHKLGYVPDSYNVLQNVEALNWFNPLIESGQATLETAGSLFNGEKIFITAKIGKDLIEVDKDDVVEKFILLSNSHNGKTAVRVGFTPVRVVCNNTLKMAHGDGNSKLIRIKHTLQMHNNLNLVQETMDLVNQQFITTTEKFKLLASRDINQSDLNKYIKTVFNKERMENILVLESSEEEVKNRLENQINAIFEQEDKKNLWTAYNSVQGYLQHERGSNRSSLESRYNNLWFGDSDRLNQKALNSALAMAV